MKTSAGRDLWSDMETVLLSVCQGKERGKISLFWAPGLNVVGWEAKYVFLRRACHGVTARAGNSSPTVNPGVSFLGRATFESLVQEEKEGRE